MSLTPAMTLFDVDGFLPPAELALAGAEAAAYAIRRLDIGGSIGIDLPDRRPREERLRVVAALDAVLPRPFERTAVNGFGFLQVIRRRERRSLPELIQWDPVGAAARDLLRTAERGIGGCELAAAPAVIARLRSSPEWLETLARRIGGPVALREDPRSPHGRAMSTSNLPKARQGLPSLRQACQRRVQALLQPGLPGPRPVELARRFLSSAGPARRRKRRGRAGQRRLSASIGARLRLRRNAQVAQLVEHVTENHGVGGSIPSLGTIFFKKSPSRAGRAQPLLDPRT